MKKKLRSLLLIYWILEYLFLAFAMGCNFWDNFMVLILNLQIKKNMVAQS